MDEYTPRYPTPGIPHSPLHLTRESQAETQKWVNEYYLDSEFNQCNHQLLHLVSEYPRGSQANSCPHLLQLSSSSRIIQKVKKDMDMLSPERETCWMTNRLKEGAGFVLVQKEGRCQEVTLPFCKGAWATPVMGNHFTTHTGGNYLPFEGETLAMAYRL